MRVQVPLRIAPAIGGLLVETHRVRERDSEQMVVARGEALEHVGEGFLLCPVHLTHRGQVANWKHHGLKRPDRPKRHERAEMLVFEDQPLGVTALQFEVIAKQTAMV